MDVMKLLEYLQEIIDTGAKVPMTGKVMIDKKEALNTLDKIVNCLPAEFKKAQWICEEKERILSNAIKDAEQLKKEHIDIMKRQVEVHDITKQAKERAAEIISSAQKDSKIMRLGSRDYANEILSQLEKEVNNYGNELLSSMKANMEQFIENIQADINTTGETLRENIKELRDMSR